MNLVRRALLIAAAGAALFVLPAQAAQAPVSARLIRCHPHPDQAKRYAIFEGEMHGARDVRMEIRFDLQRADPGGGFQLVAAPGLEVWNRAEAGVVDYRYRKRVENLPAPANYRALVRYRWRRPGGKIVAPQAGSDTGLRAAGLDLAQGLGPPLDWTVR